MFYDQSERGLIEKFLDDKIQYVECEEQGKEKLVIFFAGEIQVGIINYLTLVDF